MNSDVLKRGHVNIRKENRLSLKFMDISQGAAHFHGGYSESPAGIFTVAIGGASSAEISGVVAQIVPAADPASHSFMVKIDLPSSARFHAGMYGVAEFANGMRQAIVVPHSAVILRGSLACAYVLDGHGIAQLRYLTLGATQDDLVEVLSGLSAGEKLVDTPADRDLAGKRIEARP